MPSGPFDQPDCMKDAPSIQAIFNLTKRIFWAESWSGLRISCFKWCSENKWFRISSFLRFPPKRFIALSEWTGHSRVLQYDWTNFQPCSSHQLPMIRPAALVALVLLAEPVLAQGPPLDTWKMVMNNAEVQFRAGEPMYACRHATNLAHFMNKEITRLQKQKASKDMIRDVMWLEMDWQTYVGKYCGSRSITRKSALWPEIDRNWG